MEKQKSVFFYRKDTPPILINVNNIQIISTNHINVLGVEFDSKLTWSSHIAKQINKSNRALHAIKIIKNTSPAKN